MRVLFDQNVPRNLRQYLSGHEVHTAASMGWDKLQNGDLLIAAETQGFDVLVNGDRNLEYQQNLAARRISIVSLTRNRWPLVSRRIGEIVATVARSTPGSSFVVDCRPENNREPEPKP